jgi:hypothetical protein
MNALVKKCLRKKPYREAEARQLVKITHAQRASEGPMHCYRCVCGWWHVGHKNRLARR